MHFGYLSLQVYLDEFYITIGIVYINSADRMKFEIYDFYNLHLTRFLKNHSET